MFMFESLETKRNRSEKKNLTSGSTVTSFTGNQSLPTIRVHLIIDPLQVSEGIDKMKFNKSEHIFVLDDIYIFKSAVIKFSK